MKNIDRERFNELINEMFEQKEIFNLYFSSFLSDSLSRENCEEKLAQLEMLEEYFFKENNEEWLCRIKKVKTAVLEDLKYLL